jgi:alanine dehydrogenase
MDGGDRAASRIVPSAEDVWGEAELVLKVKEPQASEVDLLRPEVALFTYLHLAPAPDLTSSAGSRGSGDAGSDGAGATATKAVPGAH